MDSLRVVSAGNHCLCLYLYAVFLCFFERKLIEVVVIDSAPIHKADDCTLAESANTLFAVNARNIRGSRGFEHDGVIGSDAERRGFRAACAYLLLNAE